jgi:hypothetical protein
MYAIEHVKLPEYFAKQRPSLAKWQGTFAGD